MVDEQYLNNTYFKRYTLPENNILLFLLPGQSMSPRAFWDFRLPNGKTHSEYFLEAGIDVLLFDPIGYGKSTEYYNYDRLEYAKQILEVTKTIDKDYKVKALLGFSTSTNPALVAAQHKYFNKLIFHSPCVPKSTDSRMFQKLDKFESDMTKLKTQRLATISDLLIPKPNRLDGWEEAIMEVNRTYERFKDGVWSCPGMVVSDITDFYIYHGWDGYDPERIHADVLAIIGQYDFEMYGHVHFPWFVRTFKPKVVNIPDSTHFSMWENNSHLTRQAIIDFLIT
jgi:pimeloyl-ACP methyl ester carboxylesterase